MIFIGGTARSLVLHFAKHLADIRHNRSKPVAQHFNPASHAIVDIRVKGLSQVQWDSFHHKHMDLHIIQRLGTISPGGLNEKG